MKRAQRHNWRPSKANDTNPLPKGTTRCAHCGAQRRKVTVNTSRIGVHTATFTSREVPVYSADGQSWSYDNVPCTGKAGAA